MRVLTSPTVHAFLLGVVVGVVAPAAVFGALYGRRELPSLQCAWPARPNVQPIGRGFERQACVVDHGTVRRYERGVVVREEAYRCGKLVTSDGH